MITLLPLELSAAGVTNGLGISLFLFFMLAFCFFLMRKDLGILTELSWAAKEQSKGYLLSENNVACLSLARTCTEIYNSYKKGTFCLVLGQAMSRESRKKLWRLLLTYSCGLLLTVRSVRVFSLCLCTRKGVQKVTSSRQWMILVWSSFIYLSNTADSISIFQALLLAEEFKHIFFDL